VNVVPAEIHTVTGELLMALREYRKAKLQFQAAMHDARSMDRRIAAPANKDLGDAVILGKWAQGEVAALGSALAGLCLSQMGEPRA
jgi:hypothetical protein